VAAILEDFMNCVGFEELIALGRPAPAQSYAPRSTSPGGRRTKADIDTIKHAIFDIVSKNQPMTVRQVFYALTVAGAIDKTEAEYKGTVIRLLSSMRREKGLPYHWISDNTRSVRRPTTYTGLHDFIDRTARFYRRSVWAEESVYVEVWCEKDALAGVIVEETIPYDVPLMVSRGFSSDTYLQAAAEAISAEGKPAYIYHFGDHDPSGVWIAKQTEAGLRRHAPDAEIRFRRVAVTPEQISAWRLPSRPTKREGNTHARKFEGDSVELDAIPSLQLRALVRDCIEQHIDQARLAALREAERSEKTLLRMWDDNLRDAS
jgi:hypothetical protein